MSQMERTSKEFDKNQILLSKRRACVPQCYEAKIEEIKDDKKKKIAARIPCTKIKNIDGIDKCALYLDPSKKWAEEKGVLKNCIFPLAALSIKDIPKPNFRKHRGR